MKNSALQRIETYWQQANIPSSGHTLEDKLLWEAFREASQNSPPPELEVVAALEHMLESRDWRPGEFLVAMADTYRGDELESVLCRIIDTGEASAPIENGLQLLADIRSERSVPTLARAAHYRFAHDPNCEVPYRAMEALYSIGSEEAIEHIRRLSLENENPVAEMARDFLESQEDDKDLP